MVVCAHERAAGGLLERVPLRQRRRPQVYAGVANSPQLSPPLPIPHTVIPTREARQLHGNRSRSEVRSRLAGFSSVEVSRFLIECRIRRG